MRSLALLAAVVTACRPTPVPTEPAPCLLVSPELIDFGEVPNGEERSYRLRVTNISDSVRALEFALSASPSFGLEDPHAVFLVPGASADRTVRFRHDDSRLHLGTIELTAGEDCQATVQLQGLGQGTVEFEPATLDFGFVLPGQRKTLEVKVVNTRRTPVRMFNVRLDPEPTPAFTTSAPWEFELPPLTTLPISITAAPLSAVGYEATLFGRFEAIGLRTNLMVVGGVPVAQLSPSAIVVPTVGFAVPSIPPTFVDRQLWVRNVSVALDARLRIVDPEFKVEALDGGAIDLSVTIPEQLRSGILPGTEAPLEFHLRPSSLGPRSYEVTIFTNDPVQPEQKFTFEANVEALPECSLRVSPTGALRLTQFPDGTSNGTIIFTNIGPTDCVLDDVRLEEPASAFVLHDAPTQVRLAPGASHVVSVDGPPGLDTAIGTLGFHVLNANSVRERVTLADFP